MDEEAEEALDGGKHAPDPIFLCKCLLSDETIPPVIPPRKLRILNAVDDAENYLRDRRIPELMRFLLTKVLSDGSNDPTSYLKELLDHCMLFRAGHGTAPVLYEDRHLEAVIKSFDPGRRGWLSSGQVRRLYATLGLTLEEYPHEKISTAIIFKDIKKTQESELLCLLSAGIPMEESYSNVVSYQPHHELVADRLVLFMVDGLRAESFVNYTTMPYLRSVANNYGRWGISSTQVPTESRPGHVAVIAGFYEDPSAIMKGWKENPVDFDSVFNQTAYTWCWGTYDIVDIFTKGTVDNHIFVHKFDPYDNTFSTDKNTTLLDSWVFENVKNFFHKAKSDDAVQEKMRSKKIIYFLHLLGTDTSGHTHKPKTQNFLTTVRNVDQGIKDMEIIVREFYNDDGKTTFLMTSDHGMTDWGSHGSGDDHETQTPFVMWGAGVQQAKEGPEDPYTKGMSFNHRFDIKQADLTPLMSTILSIPVPVNSIGKLPVDLLNMTLPNRAKAVYSHSRQLASQYNRKKLEVETNAISLLYKPFEPFSTKKYEEIIEFTEKLLLSGEYEKLIRFSEEITQLSLAGLTYYQNYYQRPLLILVTMSFIGWILYLLKVLLEQKVHSQVEPVNLKRFSILGSHLFSNVAFLLLCFLSFYVVFAQKLPIQYYIHFLMPIFLWWNTIPSLDVWSKANRLFRRSQKRNGLWIEVLCYGLGSMAMGLSFTYRWMLSIPLMGMGLWPFFSSIRNCLTTPILIMWPASCAMLSFFSFVPVVGKDVLIELVIIAGLLWLLVISIYILRVLLPLYNRRKENRTEVVLAVIQIALLIFSLHNIYVQSRRFDQGTPVLYFYQLMSWVTAVVSLTLPMASSKRLVCRLMTINTSILIFYLLLSVAHEGLFLVTLNCNVMCWVLIEFKLLHLGRVRIIDCTFDKSSVEEDKTKRSLTSIERSISSDDFRRAFFFLAYVILAFFGTGNIASLNSFEVRWVTCFITSFQPFIITGLILLKTLTPFLSVACCFRGVQYLTEAPTGYLHIIVLIYSNIMGIQLLYYVRNTGSWLEIGTSISQFVIVQVITLFIVLINQIAKVMTDFNVFNVVNKLFKSRKKYV
ncbi:GPI ethanolamine phosphate transferase 1-like [Cydia strobilella]|uniref:GPI ethanolamine phosphate transferase 1-like n=1 Tax=Cydia strobilella TaxID=1100964 RepID=UPI003003D479